eukprot:970930-Rhodomonas_salina.1
MHCNTPCAVGFDGLHSVRRIRFERISEGENGVLEDGTDLNCATKELSLEQSAAASCEPCCWRGSVSHLGTGSS